MAPERKIGDEAEEFERELATLSRQQYEALQRYSYLHMSPIDADEYDKRRLRIGEICEGLAGLRTESELPAGHGGRYI